MQERAAPKMHQVILAHLKPPGDRNRQSCDALRVILGSMSSRIESPHDRLQHSVEVTGEGTQRVFEISLSRQDLASAIQAKNRRRPRNPLGSLRCPHLPKRRT